MTRAMSGRSGLRLIDALGAAVLLGLSTLAYMAAVRPMLAKSTSRTQLAAAVQHRQQSAVQLQRIVDSLEDRLEAARQELNDHETALEPAGVVNRRLRRLGELAARSGLEVHETQISRPADRTQYVVVPIQIRGRGNFHSMLEFLRRLHGEFPDIMVSSFDLSGNAALREAPSAMEAKLAWYAAKNTVD